MEVFSEDGAEGAEPATLSARLEEQGTGLESHGTGSPDLLDYILDKQRDAEQL